MLTAIHRATHCTGEVMLQAYASFVPENVASRDVPAAQDTHTN
jgi:hypothetical protein